MRRLLTLVVLGLIVLTACSQPQEQWTQAEPLGQVADSGFRVVPNGFNFTNFTASPNGVKLEDQDVRELLGPEACDGVQEPLCDLAPRANAFRSDSQGLAGGGVCEGLSVLSLMFYTKQRDPREFGGENAFELSLPDNPKLDRAILRWNATQLTDEVVGSLIREKPTAILDRLAQAWRTGDEDYTLGLYNVKDGKLTNGHAVVPYRIEHVGDGMVHLYLYNSNAPGGENEYIEIDTNTETWHYRGINVFYDGSAELELAPLSARMQESFAPKILDDFRGSARGAHVHCFGRDSQD